MTNRSDHLHSSFRLVVAPSAGTFQPADGLQSGPSQIHRGQVVGHIVNSSVRVAVTSPFDGHMDTFLAWPNERLRKHDRVMSMRAAS